MPRQDSHGNIPGKSALGKREDVDYSSLSYYTLVVKKLNHRPRNYLSYQSPHDVFWQASSGALAT